MSHYKPYPAYKDSGVEWLGRVPEHWSVKPLKLVAHVQTGIAKGKDNTGLKTIEVPYLRVANVQDGYLNLVDVATIEIPVDVLSRYLLQSGDVLMNEGGDFDKLGRGHVWSEEIKNCIHQNHVFAVRPHGVNPHWLNTFTGSAAAQFYFMCQSKQSTNLASISSSNLMELIIPLPPEAEVAQISSHLNRETTRIDTLIAKKTRFIELLKEKRQALITQAVTKGLNPNVKMKDSGVEWLGEVPEHWALNYLSHIARFSGGGTPNRDNPEYWNGSIPWISPKDMKTEFVIGAEECITEKGLKESSSSLVPAGRILLVVRSGILKHTIPVAINQKAVALNQDMKAVYFDIHRMEPLFFMRFVQGKNDDLLDAWLKQGATVESIEQDYLARTLLPVPPICEQQKIIEFLAKATERVAGLMSKTQLSITLLKERRSALITAAVTGQIDLRETA